jgi:hypothetical protein
LVLSVVRSFRRRVDPKRILGAMDDDHDPDLRSKEDGGIPFDQSPQSVSRPRAIALVAGAFVFTTLTSLLVTGFQGLHPILVAEKVRAAVLLDSRKNKGR